MMKKIGAFLIGLFLVAVSPVPGDAQFADQATAIQSVAGTNTITGTLPNVVTYFDIVNVLMKLTPVGTNTGPATLNLNSIGADAIVKPTAAGLVALTGGELVANQPAILMLIPGGNIVLLSVTSTTVAAANLANSALSAMGLPVNMQINAAASANQLTVSLCAINSGSNTCNNPSATSPLLMSFRDTTAANGDPVIISQQTALAFTALSTSSFGCVTATTCRLWVVGINNAGTMALCLFNALSGISVAPINEAANQTSQSGTTGGASAQLYYCSASAVTGKAIRILGYIEATWVSGTGWSTTPSLVQIFGPGIKKPGDVVQRQAGTSTAGIVCTTDTQTGVSASITPTSAANIIHGTGDVVLQGGSVGATGNARLSRGTGPTYFGNEPGIQFPAATTTVAGLKAEGFNVPSTTSPTTYYVYCGIGVTGTVSFNPANVPLFLFLEEIMSAIDPVANDNRPLRMVG